MFIYILNLVVIFVWYYIVYHSKLSRKTFLKGSLIYLFLVSSLRDKTMGADYIPYITAFNAIRATGKYYMEPGYVCLSNLSAAQRRAFFPSQNEVLDISLFILNKNAGCTGVFSASAQKFISNI